MKQGDYVFEINEKFRLSDNFLSQYEGQQPEWGPIGYVTYKRTYSRSVQDGERLEEFWETLKRVVEGCYTIQLNHCKGLRLHWNAHKAQKSAQEMYRLMWNFKFLPPGRGLWTMGTDVVWKKGGACLNNCALVSTIEINDHFSDPFIWTMDMSMLGVGVGFDTLGANKVKFVEPKTIDSIHICEDSREGWYEIVRVILDAYVGKAKIPDHIDYSEIRPAGAPIKTFGGIAPGPAPLIECITTLKQFFNERIGQEITSTDIVDLMDIVGRCVVSGGVRRTALLALGNHTDDDYMSMKDPEKYSKLMKDWRWASNNSIYAKVGMDYDDLAVQTAKNGEPGYVWLDNIRTYGRIKDGPTFIDEAATGINPCAEMSLESYELCNLVETFPSKHETAEEYRRTLKYAYLYAKSVTLVPTHSERTNQVLLRNRRIGLSMSGIVDAMYKFGKRKFLNDFCDSGYEYVRDLDKIYSRWFCIPTSIKCTTTKPSGTVSLLAGVSPGIHWPHAKYYIRRMEIQNTNPLIKTLKAAGYRSEQSVYKNNSLVFEFPIQQFDFKKSKADVTIWEQMELHTAIQHYWSDNNVSQTVTFNPETEANQISDVLSTFEDRIKAISFLPMLNHMYQQAPYEEITQEQFEEMSSEVDYTMDLSNVGNGHYEDEAKEELRKCSSEGCIFKEFLEVAKELEPANV